MSDDDVKITGQETTQLVDPTAVSNDLSSELTPAQDPVLAADLAQKKIENLKSSNPEKAVMIKDLTRYADNKLVIYERQLSNLESSLLNNIPEYIAVFSDIREMNKLKYRLAVDSYEEIKALWLKYIHDIL